jgi:hypothetical protein
MSKGAATVGTTAVLRGQLTQPLPYAGYSSGERDNRFHIEYQESERSQEATRDTGRRVLLAIACGATIAIGRSRRIPNQPSLLCRPAVSWAAAMELMPTPPSCLMTGSRDFCRANAILQVSLLLLWLLFPFTYETPPQRRVE